VEITEEDVKNLAEGKVVYPQTYIEYVTGLGMSFKYSVFTESFTKLNKLIANANKFEETLICLRGPKGCGKSFTLAATFALQSSKQCLFLSPLSFDGSTFSMDYFIQFVNDCTSLSEDEKKNAKALLENNQITKALTDVLGKKNILVFADLSCISTESGMQLLSLLKVCASFISLIFSISSGAQYFEPNTGKDNEVTAKFLRDLCNNCDYVDVEWFTEKEANGYLEKRNTYLRLEAVEHISGRNPLLLSELQASHSGEQQSVEDYQSILKIRLQKFLSNNLSSLRSNIETLKDYFLSKQMRKCTIFVKYANKGNVLTDDEVKEYKGSLLSGHQLTILRNNVLLWNFPCIADILKEMVEEFLTESTKEALVKCCKESPAFAGNWYEFSFFQHYGKYPHCSIKLQLRERSLDLKFNSFVSLDKVQDSIREGILYRTGSGFEVIDAVGLFDSSSNRKLLTFFQISISIYERHRSIADVFAGLRTKLIDASGKWKTGISISKHYENLCKKLNKDLQYDILLVYVSPRIHISSSGFQKFEEDIGKDGMCAILSTDSSFHVMMRNQPPFDDMFVSM